MRRPARQHGIAGVETLIALPILLFLGLGAVQFALVFQAKHALNHALIEAARAGSVAHADGQAIRAGLARGMLPWLYGAQDLGEYVVNIARSSAHVFEGETLGWIRIERLSPTAASFDDWAEPARDANGAVIGGLREIPNDSLAIRATLTRPNGAVGGGRAGEPIGAASGQTLADANLLKLRMGYGVPMVVPVAGRLLSWALRAWDGCAMSQPRRYGALGLDPPAMGGGFGLETCALYGVGESTPRMPVVLSATLRMQSPARE